MPADVESANAYSRFMHTDNWAVLDRALKELVQNREISESTSHEHVVGYLCQALAAPEKRPQRTREEMLTIIRAAQKAVRDANPTNRDLVAELFAERREEAARE